MSSIIIENICKSFGDNTVLENITLTIEHGSCYCLLGRNGIGKSTLLNIINDLIKPDKGNVIINNLNYKENTISIKKNIGVLAENLPLINEISGWQYLNFVGMLYNIPKVDLKSRTHSLINYFFEDNSLLERKINTFSTGMKMKLALCSALLHKPKILILDEPFNGWDPIGVNQLISFLNSFLDEDKIILMSSHNLLHIDKIATHIGVLDKRSLVYSSTLDNFKLNGNSKIEDSLLRILNVEEKDKSGLGWILG